MNNKFHQQILYGPSLAASVSGLTTLRRRRRWSKQQQQHVRNP